MLPTSKPPFKTASMTALSALAVSAILFSAPAAQAQTAWASGAGGSDSALDEKYLTLDHAEFEELAPTKPSPQGPQGGVKKPTGPGGFGFPGMGGGDDPISQAIGDLGSIVNIGQTVWQIVTANAPVATTSQNSATAVPDGIKNWTQLAGWQNPQVHNYQMSLKNGYGSTVVKFGYQLQFNSGGNFDGRGHFLANATIRATQADVVWGYHFSADATVGDVVNVGSTQDPIAGVNITITWKTGTVLKQDNGSRTFFVRGDGQVDDLSQ